MAGKIIIKKTTAKNLVVTSQKSKVIKATDGTLWGKIVGDIHNQADLIALIQNSHDHTIENMPSLGKLLLTTNLNNPDVSTHKQYLIAREEYESPDAPTLPNGNTTSNPYIGSTTLTITNIASGATLRYTINGNDPSATSGSESTNGKITLPQVNTGDSKQATLVLKVVAVKNGKASNVVSQTYYVDRILAAPTISDPTGTKYDSSRSVTITNNAVGGVRGTLKYKIGSGSWQTPTLTNNQVTISATGDVTVKVEKSNWTTKEVTKTIPLNAKKCYIGRGGETLSALTGLTGVEADNLNGERTVTLASAGYIWFVVPSGKTISSITSGPLSVPFGLIQNSVSGYNCYRTDLEITAGTYTYNIA